MFTRGGVYLHAAKAYEVDSDRLQRIIIKIVKGLFWHEYQRRLPKSHDVVAVFTNGLRQHVPDSEFCAWRNRIRTLMVGGEYGEIGNKVLVYYYNRDPHRRFCSAWGLTFYGRLHFAALTGSKRAFAKAGW